jgi:hypothetical protein
MPSGKAPFFWGRLYSELCEIEGSRRFEFYVRRHGRGRSGCCQPPPAQIPAGAAN